MTGIDEFDLTDGDKFVPPFRCPQCDKMPRIMLNHINANWATGCESCGISSYDFNTIGKAETNWNAMVSGSLEFYKR